MQHIRFLLWLGENWDGLSNKLRPRVSEKCLRLYARYERNVSPENVKLLLEKAAELQQLAVKWTSGKPMVQLDGMIRSRSSSARENWEDLAYDIEVLAQSLGLWDTYKSV